LECLFETLESVGMLLNGMDIFLKDDLLSLCGADDFRKPPEVGRAPICPAHVTDILSQQKGFETELGVFEIADGIFTRPGEIPDGFIFQLGDIDHSEITRAGEPGPLQGVSAVGFDPIAWFVGDQRGGHHPAVVAFFRQIAAESVATGTGFVDEDQMCGLRLHFAYELIDVTLAGTNSSEIGSLSNHDPGRYRRQQSSLCGHPFR
jgi:hypothetical protein